MALDAHETKVHQLSVLARAAPIAHLVIGWLSQLLVPNGELDGMSLDMALLIWLTRASGFYVK